MRKPAPVKLDLAVFSQQAYGAWSCGGPSDPGTLWHCLRDQASWASSVPSSSVTLEPFQAQLLLKLFCFPQRDRELGPLLQRFSDGSEWLMFLSSLWNSLQSSWEMSRRFPSWMWCHWWIMTASAAPTMVNPGDKYFCFRKVLIILLQISLSRSDCVPLPLRIYLLMSHDPSHQFYTSLFRENKSASFSTFLWDYEKVTFASYDKGSCY